MIDYKCFVTRVALVMHSNDRILRVDDYAKISRFEHQSGPLSPASLQMHKKERHFNAQSSSSGFLLVRLVVEDVKGLRVPSCLVPCVPSLAFRVLARIRLAAEAVVVEIFIE